MDLATSNLRALLDAGTLVSNFRYAYQLMRDITSGLDAVHAKKCWHRDLKPENILIGIDGRARLADFGLVHLDPAAFSVPIVTSDDSVLANRMYFAPELRTGNIDQRADIFAVGLIFHEMLVGEFPRGTATKPSTIHTWLGSAGDEILARLCRVNVDQRYQTISDFWNDFSRHVALSANTDVDDPETTRRLLVELHARLLRAASSNHTFTWHVVDHMDGEIYNCDVWNAVGELGSEEPERLILKAVDDTDRRSISELSDVLKALVDCVDRVASEYAPDMFPRDDVVPRYPDFVFSFRLWDGGLERELENRLRLMPPATRRAVEPFLNEWTKRVNAPLCQWARHIAEDRRARAMSETPPVK